MKHSYPLYVVTGCSASGKSTISTLLAAKMKGHGYVVYDMDTLVSYCDYQTACNNWLRVAYHNSESNIKTILCGNVPKPFDVTICDYSDYFRIHYAHLYVDSMVRKNRLLLRGGVWNETTIKYENELADNMLKEAKRAVPPIPTLNTSYSTSSEIVEQLIKVWGLK